MKVEIPNYLNLVSEENFYFDPKEISLADLLKKTDKTSRELIESYNGSRRILYYYLRGERALPIKFVLNVVGDDTHLLDEIYGKFSLLSTRGHWQDRLPKYYTSELAYLTGLIAGDGHVSKNSVISLTGDSDRKFMKSYVSSLFEKLFDYKPSFVDYPNYVVLIANSKPVHFFFTKVIGLPTGKKKGKLFVPKFIYLSEDFKKNFIRGIFDSDGGVTIKQPSILISSSTRPFLEEVQSIVRELGINMGGPYASSSGRGLEIRTGKRSEIIKFKKIVSSFHPAHLKRLNASVTQR